MIIVTGAPRSGTSIVAGTLRCLGVFMGENLDEKHEDMLFSKFSFDISLIDAIEDRKKYELAGFKWPAAHTYIDKIHYSINNPKYIFCYRNLYNRRYGNREFLDDIVHQAEWAKFFIIRNIEPLVLEYDMPQELKVSKLIEYLRLSPSDEEVSKAIGFYGTGYTPL